MKISSMFTTKYISSQRSWLILSQTDIQKEKIDRQEAYREILISYLRLFHLLGKGPNIGEVEILEILQASEKAILIKNHHLFRILTLS